MKKKAFTLIELLIVVAIIAILAAIAVPNFLEAQVRAKISRGLADMRTISVALNIYATDQNRVPIGYNEGRGAPPDPHPGSLGLWNDSQCWWAYCRMTSPVAYMSSIPLDPFTEKVRVQNISPSTPRDEESAHYEYQTYMWYDSGNGKKTYQKGVIWHLRSVGPDRVLESPYIYDIIADKNPNGIYDATNGTSSHGNIYMTNWGFLTGAQLQ